MDLKLDPSVVESAGRAQWEENLRFRKWLKNQPANEVQDAVDRIGKLVSGLVDCTQCAKCCQGLTIAPKPTDVKRLADGLHLTPFEFKTKYLKKDLEGDLVFKQRPCPFLKQNRCTVYEHRPDTCRSYPHLEKQHMAGRGWHIVENTLVCPITFNTYELLKSHFRFRDRPAAETA